MGGLSKSRVMDAVRSLVHLWELRSIYCESADLHAKNARDQGHHARACGAFASEIATQGSAFQAAFSREMAAHSQRVRDYHRQLETKYRRLALCPWNVVPPDPDPPELPDPFRINL